MIHSSRLKPTSPPAVAVVGTGPAGLMAAFELVKAGYEVSLFEKRSGPGRKLLVAGSSGLNITYDSPLPEFAANYRESTAHFSNILKLFPPSAWINFIEQKLGIKTFKGTSRRYFVEGMKASLLLKTWIEQITQAGVQIHYQRECNDFEVSPSGVYLRFAEPVASRKEFKAVCFCLGGGSWEPREMPLRWPELFKRKGLKFNNFESSNAGFKVDWPPALLKEAEGLPLKNIILHSTKASRSGDAVITSYGIEGTPVYFAGVLGTVTLDLKPDLTEEQILRKLESVKENLSPLRRVKKVLQLSPAALAVLFHMCSKADQADLKTLVARIKNLPLLLNERQPLAEAISSSGGLSWDELDSNPKRLLMLKKFPGVFAAGEMLDWDAPTGGFLIQGSVSSGYVAAQSIIEYLAHLAPP